jgi:Ni/Fe-hydrogenase subunit HybB-like protein
MVHFEYLFIGLDGKGQMVPLMWFAIVGMVITALLLTIPGLRKNETTLAALCGMVMITTWIDKGLGLMTGGFVPNPLGQVTEYWPTMPEAIITLGVWALGFLVLTILYKVAVSIKEEIRS